MAGHYADRVVIVTGGTRGIGRASVEVFAEAGAHVVFCAERPDGGDALASDVTAAGPGLAVGYERLFLSEWKVRKRVVTRTRSC